MLTPVTMLQQIYTHRQKINRRETDIR